MRHIDGVEKAMTAYCFQHCFNKKKMVVDFEKVAICYNKYLFALKTVYQTIESEGRKCQSEYLVYSLGK